MTAEEYIRSLSDKDLIFAYIECIIQEALTGEEFEDFDIFMFHKEYEDVKDEIDTLVEQARDRAIAEYPITSVEDAMRYFDECYGEDLEYDEDLVEWRKKWEEDPWSQFYHVLDEMGDWYEDNGYHFRAEEW
jgi:hypothetical protein|nr:MAG TPA: hypothetical protein [Bacteriophage sp.]